VGRVSITQKFSAHNYLSIWGWTSKCTSISLSPSPQKWDRATIVAYVKARKRIRSGICALIAKKLTSYHQIRVKIKKIYPNQHFTLHDECSCHILNS
ncbi:hypothetical protein CR513_41079, partial [Mucuna pruriens]